MKKDFKYSMITKDSGKIMVQEIVTFGSKKYPFPDDWKNNGMVISALEDYKDSLVQKYFDIKYQECSESDNLDNIENLLSKKNCIDFALWLRDNDTQENAEQFFHFSDEGMFDYWAENILIKS